MDFLKKRIAELESYLPELTKRPDFDEFWAKTLKQTHAVPLEAKVEKIDYPIAAVDVYDISYCGFDETRIHGWLIVPAVLQKKKYPAMVQYHGFTGSRGAPSDHVAFAMLGCAVLAIDCREQGGVTGSGRLRDCVLHVRPRRCRRLRLRIYGVGGCRVYSLTAVYEKGSDGP